jgi:tetratricopeptide (TPR) repeat protein
VGYGVRAVDGRALGSRPLTPLPPGPAGDLTQTLVVPLEKVPPGRYELVVQVRDDVSGQSLERREPFIVGDPTVVVAAAAAMAAAGMAGRDAAGYLALVARYRGGAPGVPEALAAWSPAELKPGVEQAKGDKACDDTCRRGAALLHLEAAIEADLRGQGPTAAAHVAAGRELLEKARGGDDFRAQWLLAVGYHLLRMARFAEAEPILDQAAKNGSAEALVGLGAIWDFRSTLETLAPGAAREAAPIGSQSLPQFQALAQRERAVRKAEEEYRRALELRPDLVEAHLRLGSLLARRDKPDQARAELELAAAGGDAAVKLLSHLFLGQLDEGKERYADAVAHYRAALAADPTSQAARLALSYALLRSGDRRAAAQAVREVAAAGAASRDAADAWVDYHLGPSRHLGDVTRALRAKVRS